MRINGTNIYMTRGDSETLTVQKKEGSFVSGDTLYLTLRKGSELGPIALQKVVTEFTDGKAVFVIEPEDTEGLAFDKYPYDVQWTQSDGTVTTLITPEKSKWEIGKETTY